MKQLIIARRDLDMSAGKLAAQVAHGSMAFLARRLKPEWVDYGHVGLLAVVEQDVYDDWICGAFTKVVCGARNRNKLLQAKEYAEAIGLKEGSDFFIIRDNCLTEIEPEDEDGRTPTVIGFRPLPDEIAREISKHYHLY